MSHQQKKRASRLRRASRFCQQAYCWRYVDHAQVDAGGEITERGYGVLAMVPPHQVDAIYGDAQRLAMHWQVILIAYARNAAGEEYREWGWVHSRNAFRAEGDRITPLIEVANQQAMAGVDEGDEVFARGVIMAPWTAGGGVTPDRLAARLKTRLRLEDHEIQAIRCWEAPIGSDVLTLDHPDAGQGARP
jgi:hypothetical protein